MEPFIGEIRLFAGTFAPVDWNFCDGTLLSISGNDALFNLISTTYGGDGVNTFAVPDLRGRVPIHVGQQNAAYALGQTGGAETVLLTTDNLPAHNHLLSVSTQNGTDSNPTGDLLAVAPTGCNLYIERPPNTPFAQQQIQPSSTGAAAPHENRQPYVAVNYIIATAGVYPSQG